MTELEHQIVKACGEIDRLRDVNAELLAALKQVTEYAERYADLADDQHDGCSKAIAAAYAAIAKAESR